MTANRKTLTITFRLGQDTYDVSPLPCDGGIGRKAFRLIKTTPGAEQRIYDVLQGRYGLQCDCMGFLRWSHCKHAQALQSADAIFSLGGRVNFPNPIEG